MIICTGPVNRSVSAKAGPMSWRSARTSAICSGLSSRFRMVSVMAFSVVSPPAVNSRLQKPRMSSSLICTPSNSLVTMAVSRSSPGLARRSVILGMRYSPISTRAAMPRRFFSSSPVMLDTKSMIIVYHS